MQVDSAPVLDETMYRPRGNTALLDAIGHIIEDVTGSQSKSWADIEEDEITIVILTDGIENASKQFSKSMIGKMITDKKKLGWSFIFMGANQDAIATARDINIDNNSALTFTPDRIHEAFHCASSAISRHGQIEFTQEERMSSC